MVFQGSTLVLNCSGSVLWFFKVPGFMVSCQFFPWTFLCLTYINISIFSICCQERNVVSGFWTFLCLAYFSPFSHMPSILPTQSISSARWVPKWGNQLIEKLFQEKDCLGTQGQPAAEQKIYKSVSKDKSTGCRPQDSAIFSSQSSGGLGQISAETFTTMKIEENDENKAFNKDGVVWDLTTWIIFYSLLPWFSGEIFIQPSRRIY